MEKIINIENLEVKHSKLMIYSFDMFKNFEKFQPKNTIKFNHEGGQGKNMNEKTSQLKVKEF